MLHNVYRELPYRTAPSTVLAPTVPLGVALGASALPEVCALTSCAEESPDKHQGIEGKHAGLHSERRYRSRESYRP